MSRKPTTYVVLLRGINVGGHAKVSMPALRRTCESIGGTDVETYIQSGNVVLDSAMPPKKLEAELGRAVAETLGVSPTVMVRTSAEIAAVLAQRPFPRAPENTVHVAFLLDAPDPERLEGLAHDPEELLLSGREVFLHLPNGVGRAKLPGLVAKRAGTPVTIRNWATVTKLAAMADR